MEYIRNSAKREEHEDGVEKITAEAFVPFVEQRRRERLFARQTVGVHNNLFR
jgi:glutamate racemase